MYSVYSVALKSLSVIPLACAWRSGIAGRTTVPELVYMRSPPDE
jgi:hypothetical protein